MATQFGNKIITVNCFGLRAPLLSNDSLWIARLCCLHYKDDYLSIVITNISLKAKLLLLKISTVQFHYRFGRENTYWLGIDIIIIIIIIIILLLLLIDLILFKDEHWIKRYINNTSKCSQYSVLTMAGTCRSGHDYGMDKEWNATCQNFPTPNMAYSLSLLHTWYSHRYKGLSRV